ncbi:phosphotriesterase-related protein [Streptomyces sp. NPDC051976]|uniref:phosphotriesterase family protein n=1 Tax=Streptomyces sp. NPDC051976 TaxID=3154947 RepID=UPI003434EA6E
MSAIPTVTGTLDSTELGRTLVHEHVFISGEEYRLNYPGGWDEEARVAAAVDELNELHATGIDTIMDPTVLGLGRYIPRMQRVAAQTPLNIVVATGVYTMNDLPLQFQYRGPGCLVDKPEPMTSLFISDIVDGIADTGVRAAFLKCAIDEPGLTEGVERAMRAVGQASIETGAPITVHTSAIDRTGLIAQRVLRSEGVDLSKVIIGHSGDTADLDYLCALADAGSYLGMDRFGVDTLLPLARRVSVIVELVRRGYLDRIVIAHDYQCWIDFYTNAEKRETLGSDWSFRYISEQVLPAFLKAGLTEDHIDAMLVRNPRRHLEAGR